MNAATISIKPLGLGSDYFGPCECCGKRMSEAFKLTRTTHVVTSYGKAVAIKDPGLYGHEECVSAVANRVAA